MMSANPPPTTPIAQSVTILGGGPAGLYAALLIKKSDPTLQVKLVERNPAGVTYGWGVVFSDRTLASFQRADYKTYERITGDFVIWDAIDVYYRGETIRCGGHVIAGISRMRLLTILQERCAELGVDLQFGVEVEDISELGDFDLLIAADGVNSMVRNLYEPAFKPTVEWGRAKYIWLGADKVLDAFTFIFHENRHGLFQVHAYPFNGTTSTFIVECDEQTWRNAGLDQATEDESLAYCMLLLKDYLAGATLLSNHSRWVSFPTIKTRRWHAQLPCAASDEEPGATRSVVLLGDAAHTAHFSIGSGTKLAMEDAIALANALEQHADLEAALDAYELERKPVVETFQRAAQESMTYFETIKRYLSLDPVPFAFQLLTRSGRITYDDLHLRDAQFGALVDNWMQREAQGEGQSASKATPLLVSPPPMFAPLRMRGVTLPNRVVMSPLAAGAEAAQPPGSYAARFVECAEGGAGLVLTDICAVSPDGRITPGDLELYQREHAEAWAGIVERVHGGTGAKVGVQLGHAGRRGSTRPRSEGLDRPLREGSWPLLSASAIPYTPANRTPKEMDRSDMDCVREEFSHATKLADEAGFDMLQLYFAHGYLLAGFLSPLTNKRGDEYGGSLENRARFPLELFNAVRAGWPQNKPLLVALNATDYVEGGTCVEDAVWLASRLKEQGCDLVQVQAGQTTPRGEPPYAKGFLTPLSDRVRNEAGIPTLVGGFLTTSNEANTVLAAGRGDLCILDLW